MSSPAGFELVRPKARLKLVRHWVALSVSAVSG